MRVFADVEELRGAVGEDLGTSPWVTVDQKRVDTFADATDDHQWIHVDPEAAAEGPFGKTVAHGFLTVALMPKFGWDTFKVEGVSMTVNYGLNKVRFPAMLATGSRFRMHVEVAEVKQLGESGVEVVWRLTYEVEGKPKPCCVADLVFRYYS